MDGLLAAKENGKRQWMYPLVRKGRFYKWRSWLSYFYLIFFFAGPFLRINGQPLLLLNVIDRQFVLLGQVFWPQDIFLFMLASLVFLVCVVIFTIAFGRIFCGWICPQTIFMEMVFRKIEIWIEGDANKRKKLDAGAWTREKIIKKTAKHALFVLVSFLIANTFLAYIIGSESLVKIIVEPVTAHWVGFISIWVFTIVFYLIYSQVRELVCTLICPYGRLQSVLIDEHTLVVAYDDVRGEPRGKLSRNADPFNLKGDCVDCSLCVAVCPTGIDIRKGTQIECINCTACIDACDQVMDKIGKPRNLIGYFSENMIRLKEKPSFTGRMMGYTAVITVLVAVLGYFIFSRSDMDITVMRSAGMLYQQQPGGYISNIYNAEIINKTNQDRVIRIGADDPAVKISYIQAPGPVAKGGSAKTVFFVMLPASKIYAAKTTIKLNLLLGGKVVQSVKTNFIAPTND
ncbi:cytochrome c oxidase accessory protein FixG [Mucilaginibacter sp. SG538B]|uniref:cytochrome c oxidase accessory protein CcoG n=1 Tax=unclassified Mucilaginibacter TaxID=2617802 RepID=UPI0008718F25|nr:MULTISPECIES: cytochrome c oxidase accessory protein CcoG [unclassified Mucilaginibacter]NVM67188.1 cytochrome c oxidase accessory protein FixG [Mucilaginibacter sp. SG538B]SCW81075.1 cytochrome c oxidase accessory protein FixG [Mucilaginibacter sp. NFR10]